MYNGYIFKISDERATSENVLIKNVNFAHDKTNDFLLVQVPVVKSNAAN